MPGKGLQVAPFQTAGFVIPAQIVHQERILFLPDTIKRRRVGSGLFERLIKAAVSFL